MMMRLRQSMIVSKWKSTSLISLHVVAAAVRSCRRCFVLVIVMIFTVMRMIIVIVLPVVIPVICMVMSVLIVG